MNFEGSNDELEMLSNLTVEETVEYLLRYPNVYCDISEFQQSDKDPSFYIQRISTGNLTNMELDEHRILIQEGENGTIDSIEIG